MNGAALVSQFAPVETVALDTTMPSAGSAVPSLGQAALRNADRFSEVCKQLFFHRASVQGIESPLNQKAAPTSSTVGLGRVSNTNQALTFFSNQREASSLLQARQLQSVSVEILNPAAAAAVQSALPLDLLENEAICQDTSKSSAQHSNQFQQISRMISVPTDDKFTNKSVDADETSEVRPLSVAQVDPALGNLYPAPVPLPVAPPQSENDQASCCTGTSAITSQQESTKELSDRYMLAASQQNDHSYVSAFNSAGQGDLRTERDLIDYRLSAGSMEQTPHQNLFKLTPPTTFDQTDIPGTEFSSPNLHASSPNIDQKTHQRMPDELSIDGVQVFASTINQEELYLHPTADIQTQLFVEHSSQISNTKSQVESANDVLQTHLPGSMRDVFDKSLGGSPAIENSSFPAQRKTQFTVQLPAQDRSVSVMNGEKPSRQTSDYADKEILLVSQRSCNVNVCTAYSSGDQTPSRMPKTDAELFAGNSILEKHSQFQSIQISEYSSNDRSTHDLVSTGILLQAASVAGCQILFDGVEAAPKEFDATLILAPAHAAVAASPASFTGHMEDARTSDGTAIKPSQRNVLTSDQSRSTDVMQNGAIPFTSNTPQSIDQAEAKLNAPDSASQLEAVSQLTRASASSLTASQLTHKAESRQKHRTSLSADAEFTMRTGDASLVQIVSQNALSTKERSSTKETDLSPFTFIDAGTSFAIPHRQEQSMRRAEAGFEDPALGWINVSAESNAHRTDIHASITTESEKAAQLLSTHQTAMQQFLREHQSPITTVAIDYTLNHSSSGHGGFAQQQGREEAQPWVPSRSELNDVGSLQPSSPAETLLSTVVSDGRISLIA